MADVTVLLATYNGAAFLRQQIDSVLCQSFSDFQLILSDDGSTDDTVALLERYAREHPDRITLYRSGRRFGCAQTHFMHLLERFHHTPYIMFCDQDDVWHPDKIEKTLQKIQSLETDPAIPLLVHTDLRVVDGQLNELSPSFWQLSNLDGSRTALNQLLVQNVVTGCTTMVNRSLAALACEVPPSETMLMHDWWLAILAAATGKIGFLPEATMDYRQHGTNSVGAKDIRSPAYILYRLRCASMRKSLQDAADQANSFLKHYENRLSSEQIALLRAFIASRDKNLLQRDRIYLRYHLLKFGAARKCAQLLGL